MQIVSLSILLVGKPPGTQEGSTRNVDQLFIVNPVGRVRWAVIIGVPLGMVPHDGDSVLGKPGIVTATGGVVPRTVIG